MKVLVDVQIRNGCPVNVRMSKVNDSEEGLNIYSSEAKLKIELESKHSHVVFIKDF